MSNVFYLLFTLFPLSVFAQPCATPTQSYELEQQKKQETIRLKSEREEAQFRQQQLQLEEAQLKEMQEQRAVMEEELQEMNASQQRMEALQRQEAEERVLDRKQKKKVLKNGI